MSHSTPVDEAPHALVTGELPLVTTEAPSPSTRARTCRPFWLLLIVTLLSSALLYSPLWHSLLRAVLVRLAARHGCDLTIGRMQGGPLGPIHFYDVHWYRSTPSGDAVDAGTDLRVANAELTLAWRIPWLQTSALSNARRLVLTGVSGRWDLATASPPPANAAPRVPPRSGNWLDRLSARLVPTECFFQGDDLTLQRNRYRLRLRGLRLSCERNVDGRFLAREVEIVGPGFENTLLNRHGRTLWQDDRLSISGLDFGPGVRLVEATLDGSHLKRQRLDWQCDLTVMGGEVRGQGAVNFVHPRLALEVAGSVHRMPVAPLARLLGLTGPAAGLVEQGNFSFRGDPEDWPSAQMWLAAQATDFRWGQRDWQNLELRATVLHRRIQIRRFELQQSRNRLSLTGECPLVTAGQSLEHWWEAGFACNVDARLDDLHSLAQLFGARLPGLDGRMSVNGVLEAIPGRPGIDGYLNIEGSRLKIRGAPLDYLHSTLLFHGGALSVADLQATRGEDYLSGRGSISLTGASRYDGELHFAVANADIYAPALAGLLDLGKVGLRPGGSKAPVRLEGVFYGPNPEGKTVLLTFGNLCQLPTLPTPVDDDWWGDNWLEWTLWPDGRLPPATAWQL